jgi:serine/threonine protein phosphatase 1
MIAFSPAPATLPPDTRIYAIGDVHGCLELLSALHREVAADLRARPVADAWLIHLGDYIDRGPDSAQVIACLLGDPVPGTRRIDLMGNHEAMLLAALEAGNGDPADHWRENGGADALASWGIGLRTARADWSSRIPPEHLAFVRNLARSHRAGGYLFVHAGIRPGVALADQSEHDLLWMREPFLSYKGDFGAVVVHGHTPCPAPERRANRIGIDTGAVYGGDLTCVVLEADRIGFLQVAGN